MFDTNFIYFSVAIDFRVALGLALPCIPSLSHCADNCGSPSCSPATLISLPCSLTRGCAENLFSVLAIWNSHFVPLLFFSLARRHPSHSHASTQASQPTKLSVRPHSRRRPKSTPPKDQGTRTLLCGAAPEATWNKQTPEPSRDLPGTIWTTHNGRRTAGQQWPRSACPACAGGTRRDRSKARCKGRRDTSREGCSATFKSRWKHERRAN
jgi:hypothetical protein